ncbi:hypothetical protein B0A48_14030 [Cryoendolithus antarcticus]|uniref:Zn(2)-C6 fungal-type domain-containing protein n=1 Tax=Cryoendolithus antarcticus TaxID=1507870 RepID=A0A1V8SM87_9PEZI|nr:hypothetical protein B0A48_14030 [Cryoendolithus antarcticus]
MAHAVANGSSGTSVVDTNGLSPSIVSQRASTGSNGVSIKPKQKSRRKKADEDEDDPSKRRCVSTACIACRKRKSKCDGATPACAACQQVYNTDCTYDPNSDHRRKGVYKNEVDTLKTRDSTLHTLMQAILNYPEEDVPALIKQIRTCEDLDDVADKVARRQQGQQDVDSDEDMDQTTGAPAVQSSVFETTLYGKMGDLRLDDGSVRYIGGTSNLIHLGHEDNMTPNPDEYLQQEDPITSWTTVTDDPELTLHLLRMYFTWHYTYFTTLSRSLFYRDFLLGCPPAGSSRKTYYCTPLLVNAILALGCHFTANPGARDDPEDSATAGDHFFREAKRLIMANDEHEKPRLTTVQALALMSVREAGCAREAKGWVYSGMSFRMALDMGLNLDSGKLTTNKHVNGDEAEEDVRRITFWGCFLFDKAWSNYLGRLPQLPNSLITAPKPEVFPDEDSAQWSPYTDSGFTQSHAQPARTRAVALQISKLCEISSDLMQYFYNPSDMDKAKGKQAELKKLSEIHTRLEAWRRELPKELEPKEGGLSSVLVMHMFFQLLFIHLFRPFLKYTQATSPLPPSVSPRKLCTQAAAMISKLLRLYKRSHGLRQICNIAVYIIHSACTIHFLNLPDKNAKRDVVHGVKHLEEIAESWLCARRALGILNVLALKWKVEMPEEAAAVLARTETKFGSFKGDVTSPVAETRQVVPPTANGNHAVIQQPWMSSATLPQAPTYFTPPVPALSPYAINGTSAFPTTAVPTASYQLPPTDASTLHALPHPSATTTPARSTQGNRQTSSASTRSGASPSAMFGGIEQLLRDSQDWAYRDQASLATGFGNWGGEPLGGWLGSQAAVSAITTGTTAGGSGLTSNGMYGINGSGTYGHGNNMGAQWTEGPDVQQEGLMTYNEDEWYQAGYGPPVSEPGDEGIGTDSTTRS